MHVGKNYSLWEFLVWTKRDILILAIVSAIPTVMHYLGWLRGFHIPWVAIALVGTAAAFIIGFKNTQTYNRLWEARQIWGAIVNGSRSWGIMTRDFVDDNQETHRELVYRHIAWLTALRHQLRKPQTWENQDKPHNKQYRQFYRVPEWESSLEEDLNGFLSETEKQEILKNKNRATQIIAHQSKRITELKNAGKITDFEYVQLEKQLTDFYEQQGKCERIKNFPYPRQFSSITMFLVWLFVGMLPFGLVGEFDKLEHGWVWLNIPVCTIVSWVFTAMDKVGEATENPFEGGANDIPMCSMSRTIEIDLREMLGETELPDPVQAVNNILL